MSGSDSHEDLMEITPQVLLKAYACGIFPMAESADDPNLFWVEPEMRGIIPLHDFHIPRSLKKSLRKTQFDVTIDTDFHATIAACAQQTPSRDNTWINTSIRRLYGSLYEMGHAHSFEVREDGNLIGGLYGVRLGRAFFGESMFSRRTDASKIALVHLVYHMLKSGFVLLDTQFTTKHLEKFGAVEVKKRQYQNMLEDALLGEAFFDTSTNQDGGATSDSILQFFSHIS